MIRRTLVLSSLAAVTLSLMACGGGGQSPAASPLAPTPAPEGQSNPPTGLPTELPQLPSALSSNAGLGGVALNGDLSQSALAIYTVDIDPTSMQATASLKATRAGAANDDLFLLSIDSFLNASSFRIVGIGASVDTVDLTWQLAHPFPAPSNPTGASNGSTNRADLGIAGQVVLLADVASAANNTYFTDVVLNTDLVTNTDAYLQPAGLLDLTGSTANAFPYQSIVDETQDGTGSRKGISNSGDVTGNFGTDGWTRAEFGPTNDGWTGFGVLHQGQTSTRVLSLDKGALGASGFSLDVAVLAKYNDPRGGATAAEKKANRLPPATADATKFAYRMPHGALDVERVVFEGETGGFIPNVISASELRFHVVDSDARATETTAADLSADAAFNTVAVGESGVPTLDVCIPGVLGDATTINTWDGTTVADDDSAAGGDPGQDSGLPGDALYYSKLITKGTGTGQTDGTYSGLVRATDVEDALDPSLTIGLDGELAPLTSNLPRPITFQSFTVDSITPNDPPTATVAGPGSNVASGNGMLTITVNPYNDVDGDPIDIRFDWNNDLDFGDLGEGYQTLVLPAPDTFNSPIFYTNGTAGSLVRDVPYEFTDNVNPSITGTANFTLGANQTPTGNATILPAGTVLSGAPIGTVSLSVTAYSDAEVDAVLIDIDWNNDLDFADIGETGNSVVGATPVSFPSPLKYDNTTLVNSIRTIRYRFRDAINSGAVSSPTFTLGPNRAPIVTAGTVGLASNSLVTPATFSITSTGLTISDPESNPISYTAVGTPNSGPAQTTSNATFPFNNGPYTNPPATSVTFVAYANDALHPTTSGTLMTTSPSPLTGTITIGGCALTMASVDCTLATLTTGSVLRSGTAVQPITGIQVGWADVAGEAQYAIQRGTWPNGATIASVAFATIGTAVANATSYDDTTAVATGTRYLYRVMPRCSVGGPDIATPSQLAMVALQNFEAEAVGTLNNSLPPTDLANGWGVNCATANVNPTVPWSQVTIDSALAISGSRSLYIPEVHESSPSNTQGWETFCAPGLNDRANFANIAVSRLELNHGGNDFSGTSGYTFLTNASRPNNGLPLPAGPNTWTWIAGPAATGRTYTDNNASSFTTNCFSNITTAAGGSVVSGTTLFHFGDLGAPAPPMHPPGFSAFNVPSTFGATNHDFVFLCSATADNSRIEGIRYDDIAWIVY